jgi:Uma2 family endonuclease
MTAPDLTHAPARPALTVADFERFADAPENTDRRFELIHGEIIEKVPTEEHAVIAGNIHAYLWNFNKQHQLGGRVGVEPRHKIPGDDHNARLPDVAYTSAARALPVTRSGSVPQMPDLCVEVASPDDTPRLLREKAFYYLSNGAVLVWLAYPGVRRVEVCTRNADGAMAILTVGADGTLDGGALLPGFTLPVADIFELG